MMPRQYITQKLSTHEQQALVSRLEPYLKSGLSIRAACLESGVSRSTLYRLMDQDDGVRDQITHFQNYLSVMVTWMMTRHLLFVKDKQDRGVPLEWMDLKFLTWFATHSKSCHEEFGQTARTNGQVEASIDPFLERRKLRQMIENYGGVCS